MFVPVDDIGAIIESLEIGNTKILFRAVKRLDESVQRAEIEAASTVTALQPVSEESNNKDASLKRVDDYPRSDANVSELLSGDKELALIKIGIEIERSLSQLQSLHRLRVSPPSIWGKNLRLLEDEGIISHEVVGALLEFRQVRNRLVHPTDMRVPESLIGSAIDSGIKLLRLLKNRIDYEDLGE